MADRAARMIEKGRRAIRRAGRRWLGAPRWLESDSATGVVLSLDPPIINTTLTWPEPASYLWAFGSRIGRRPAALLVCMSWHFDGGYGGEKGMRQVAEYRRHFPMHEIHFLANSPDEIENFARLGETAVLLNQNLAVSERHFFPVEDVAVDFDAIYNARFDPMKRIELAAEIDRVAYVTRPPQGVDPATYARIEQGVAALYPRHQVLNPRENGIVRDMDPAGVNRALARASVGLCLSGVEGAMLASMEYLLAGVPIVSTPSKGGRDFFFDDDYCLVVPADPRSIREATIALKARAIPRSHVRNRTLIRVEAQRRSFLALLDEILPRLGHPPRFGSTWPWLHRRDFFTWGRIDDHFAAAVAERDLVPGPVARNEHST